MKLYYLSNKFYQWAVNNIAEIEHKYDRPYAMVCIKVNNHIFAIPLRSNISHPNCYVTEIIDFKTSKGLDYSKALIITLNDLDKLGKPMISQKEFNLLKGKDRVIANQFIAYINDYKDIIEKHRNNTGLHKHEEDLINFSTLQNYHNEIFTKI